MTFTCLSDTEYCLDFFLMNLIKDVQAIKNSFDIKVCISCKSHPCLPIPGFIIVLFEKILNFSKILILFQRNFNFIEVSLNSLKKCQISLQKPFVLIRSCDIWLKHTLCGRWLNLHATKLLEQVLYVHGLFEM